MTACLPVKPEEPTEPELVTTAGARAVAGWYPCWGKRWFDFALVVLGLVVVGAPMAFIALVTRLADGRPVLFAHERVGQRGRRFRALKFRTMRLGGEADSSVTVRGDRRVTRWGAFLRRWKLDELPQLINVLKGEMSLGGPRPDVPGYLDRLEGEDAVLLESRPGITGPASLAFGQEEELLARVAEPQSFNDLQLFPAKVRINRKYAARISLRGDLQWMILTLAPRRFCRRVLRRDQWLAGLPETVTRLMSLEDNHPTVI